MTGTAAVLRRFARMMAWGREVRLLFRVAILAATVFAMIPAQSSAKAPRPVARHHLRHHLARRAATRQPLRLRLRAADDFGDARAEGRDVAFDSPLSAGDGPRTSIDYRLARRGPVGSLGLLRPGDTRAAPPAYVAPAASLRRGYPEVTAGAKLSYPF